VASPFLRRATVVGLRRGASGSRFWMAVGVAAIGVRVLQRLAKPGDAVLYRTAIHAGDVFEVIAKPPGS
jgi:hypothetical protein